MLDYIKNTKQASCYLDEDNDPVLVVSSKPLDLFVVKVIWQHPTHVVQSVLTQPIMGVFHINKNDEEQFVI